MKAALRSRKEIYAIVPRISRKSHCSVLKVEKMQVAAEVVLLSTFPRARRDYESNIWRRSLFVSVREHTTCDWRKLDLSCTICKRKLWDNYRRHAL